MPPHLLQMHLIPVLFYYKPPTKYKNQSWTFISLYVTLQKTIIDNHETSDIRAPLYNKMTYIVKVAQSLQLDDDALQTSNLQYVCYLCAFKHFNNSHQREGLCQKMQ